MKGFTLIYSDSVKKYIKRIPKDKQINREVLLEKR